MIDVAYTNYKRPTTLEHTVVHCWCSGMFWGTCWQVLGGTKNFFQIFHSNHQKQQSMLLLTECLTSIKDSDKLLAISTVKLLNLREQRHLLGEIWHPSSLPYFKNLPALWTIKNAKGPYYTGTNLNIEMLRAAINGHCTIYPLCKKQSS